MTTLGEMIREARQSADVSVADLAERTGVAANTVYRWERDELEPSISTLRIVAGALGTRFTVAFGNQAEIPDSSDGG